MSIIIPMTMGCQPLFGFRAERTCTCKGGRVLRRKRREEEKFHFATKYDVHI